MIPYVYYTPYHAYHCGPRMHPEQPKRIMAITQRLENHQLNNQLVLHEYKPQGFLTGDDDLTDIDYWNLKDGDTYKTSYTDKIVLASQHMIDRAIEHLFNQNTHCAFVLCRPPGHHAADNPSGFCIANNVWYAVESLIKKRIRNIAIYDWDVHHGDGTEALLRSHTTPSYGGVRFVSTHAYGDGVYPGTGQFYESKQLLNLPLSVSTDSSQFKQVFDEKVYPFITQTTPDIVLISAGYDAHKSDPMKLMKLNTDVYKYMAEKLRGIGCPVLFVLEGGYNPTVLADCVESTLYPFMPVGMAN